MRFHCKRLLMIAPAMTLATMLAACSDSGDDNEPATALNTPPGFITGTISRQSYDGITDDLLTAGLGYTGLSAPAPAYADPAAPTASELRRNAIHANYRALIDYTAAGGFGSVYGPNIDPDGMPAGDGKIAGSEFIGVSDDGSGQRNVVLMVQVPDSFDATAACIVTGSSSGSRGIYGAVGTAGEWGLKRGCAVAYTDKGTGNGLHDQQSDVVLRIDGTLSTADVAGNQAHFRSGLTDEERAEFSTGSPDRVAYKHAHSQQNPESRWGLDTLEAVQFAFYVLNEQYGEFATGQPERRLATLEPSNTVVIASSVSNGGGAALAAAEQDVDGLIDGVAVSEPNVQPMQTAGLSIRQGSTTIPTIGKPLIDYFSFANIYQPCALLAQAAGSSLAEVLWPPAYDTAAANRCSALQARGLIDAGTLAAQADEALELLHSYGWQAENDFLQQSHYRFATNAIVMTYVNAYGRFAVSDSVCGFSFANTAVDGSVVPQDPQLQAALFASGNGIPPTTGINVVYDDAIGGATLDFLAVSPVSGSADFALDGALCMRELVTGTASLTGEPLTGTRLASSDRVRQGMAEVQLTARLHGIPAVIVAGRNDTLVPVNHAARAYYAAHRNADGGDTSVRYYEVTNAQHFDTFIALGDLLGYDTRFVPLHVYFTRAMDLMWEHLQNGTELPPSQVVRTTAREVGAMLALDDVPAVAQEPAETDLITYSEGTLQVPD